MSNSNSSSYRSLEQFQLSDLEAIRLLLRGGSVIDWHRLNFESPGTVSEFLNAQEFDMDDPQDVARSETIKREAIQYLRRNFEFPIPKPVARASIHELILLASSRGHRQLCACTILKVMHIIHHIQAGELRFMLSISDQEVFQLAEQKVYRVIGGMLASGLPILEFIGGRKNKDSVYTKLLSKQETIAAQIYDRLRFRIVARGLDDVFPILNYLMRFLFPFNYAIPGQSINTLVNFHDYCRSHHNLDELTPRLQLSPEIEALPAKSDNQFTSPKYRTVQFVVDLPIRLPDATMEQVRQRAPELGRIMFCQTEFQIIDRVTDHDNELGDASHASYKARQKQAVTRRLKLGLLDVQERDDDLSPD